MIKAPIDLQDLRRGLSDKAKAEPAWRFWGLYVHVCKLDALREASALAKRNDGAPGIGGVTFAAIEAGDVEGPLGQVRDELLARAYRPLRNRRKELPKDGAARSAPWGPPPSGAAWPRGRSSPSWNLSSRPTSGRGRLATGRGGRLMRRCNGSLRPSSSRRRASSTSTCALTSAACGMTGCWREWPVG